MKIFFYCGCYKELTSLIDESVECGAEGEVEVEEKDWKNGDVYIECPECGAELHQSMNHFKVITNKGENSQ